MTHIAKGDLESFIRRRDFSTLFIDLGWDTEKIPTTPLSLSLPDGKKFELMRVAEKRGFVVCVCDAGENYPTSKTDRRHLLNQLARHHYEHLLIICGEGKQRWAVSIRPQNRPLGTIEVEWNENQGIQLLMEKLDRMIFDISEEDTLGITDVVERVRHAFMENSEKITRKFYGEFQQNLSAFADFIEGIESLVSKEWYAALMLNRLMFIYFIQKKHFLDGDVNYLENRLAKTKSEFGDDKFHDKFYRHFLRRLFTEGLGTPQADRGSALNALLGKVPYLNGGLFDLHEVEHDNHDITIPDQAFTNLFAFFGKYNWHLDSRMTATGKDINPDVIGYIFEKYINNRAEMGAYYTQEDVTGYIARNTIIPFLLNRAKKKCKNAFDAENGIWRFLRENPDHYIYDAVKKGCELPDTKIPENIHCGLDASKPKLLERRKDWNTLTAEKFALPTEIWRETIARRTRYFSLIGKIKNGEIHEIDDLITHNLDMERFAADALRWYEGSDFIDAFYAAIAGKKGLKSNQKSTRGITVLDPACGSGAFLFAALNILEPLYGKCVERMRDFIDEDDHLHAQGKRKGTKKHGQFREVINDINTHQNEKYWIYKTIILNNLYGVDLMKEASEIAKLRLFLKLAAEAEYAPNKKNLGLEPLPDIDFNIRSGNSLVGFASMKQFEEVVSGKTSGQARLESSKELVNEIQKDADFVKMANDSFRYAQDAGEESYRKEKTKLSKRLTELNDKMNHYLSQQYGKGIEQGEEKYENWLKSHQPFHWLAEFYGIVEEDGGFDVVIGNPPYIEYRNVMKGYTIKDYKTESCGNLYAYMMELAIKIQNQKSHFGMIVPISVNSTDGYMPLRDLILQKSSVYISSYSHLVGKLFDISNPRLSIVLYDNEKRGRSNVYTTCYNKLGSPSYRPTFFQRIQYQDVVANNTGFVYKLGAEIEKQILIKLSKKKNLFLTKKSTYPVHFTRKFGWYLPIINFMPEIYSASGHARLPSEFKSLYLLSQNEADEAFVALNSNLFYWFVTLTSDCRNLNAREIKSFPLSLGEKNLDGLSMMSGKLTEYLQSTSEMRTYGNLKIQYFFHRKFKPFIDEIDSVLAKHYNFTEEELDYIINYDVKHRS